MNYEIVISSINSYRLRSNQFVTAYEFVEQSYATRDILNQRAEVRAIDPDHTLNPDFG